VYEEFTRKVVLHMKRNEATQKSITWKQLDEDLDNFDVDENLALFIVTCQIKIKKVIYRSITLFI